MYDQLNKWFCASNFRVLKAVANRKTCCSVCTCLKIISTKLRVWFHLRNSEIFRIARASPGDFLVTGEVVTIVSDKAWIRYLVYLELCLSCSKALKSKNFLRSPTMIDWRHLFYFLNYVHTYPKHKVSLFWPLGWGDDSAWMTTINRLFYRYCGVVVPILILDFRRTPLRHVTKVVHSALEMSISIT